MAFFGSFRLISTLKTSIFAVSEKSYQQSYFCALFLNLSAFAPLIAVFYQPLCSQSFQWILRVIKAKTKTTKKSNEKSPRKTAS